MSYAAIIGAGAIARGNTALPARDSNAVGAWSPSEVTVAEWPAAMDSLSVAARA